MRRRWTKVDLMSASLDSSATAANVQGAVSVVSSGAARTCFQAARSDGPAREGAAACSDALESGTLTSDDRAATFVNRGILRVRLSQISDALSDYNASLDMRPNLAEAYVDRGAALIKINRFDDAIADLSKGIALGTASAHIAFYDRGQARELTGDFSGACEDYRQALVLQPDFVEAKRRTDVCAIKIKHKPS